MAVCEGAPALSGPGECGSCGQNQPNGYQLGNTCVCRYCLRQCVFCRGLFVGPQLGLIADPYYCSERCEAASRQVRMRS